MPWVVAQEGRFWHLNHVFDEFGQGRLRNVRLAALNLKGISGVYLDGSGGGSWDSEIPCFT